MSNRTVDQVNFSGGQIRDDLTDRADIDLRQKSARDLTNMRVLSTGGVEGRPGMRFLRTISDAKRIINFEPGTGLQFVVVFQDTSVEVFGEDGNIAASISTAAWQGASSIWAITRGNVVIVGGDGVAMQVLTFYGGVWSLSAFSFLANSSGEIQQPYWAFGPGISLHPSGRTGSVSITASASVFQSGHVGQRIRYVGKEIAITSVSSSTLATGTVISQLPPSYRVTIEDVTGFKSGEAVSTSESTFSGVIESIEGSALKIVAMDSTGAPLDGETISAPNASSEIQAVTEISPRPSFIWDEALISPVRGYPGAAALVGGRLALGDFPNNGPLVAISSARDIDDFYVGSGDDDAILREIGDNAPRIRHLLSAGDLIILTESGGYFVQLRDGSSLTPLTFGDVKFDTRGAGSVAPVVVQDSFLFVDVSSNNVLIGRLGGDVSQRWLLSEISDMYGDLIKSPVDISGPATRSGVPEKYAYVVNADGTLAVISWSNRLDAEAIGVVPWSTQGAIFSLTPAFDTHWAAVTRTINGASVQSLEKFDASMYLDSAVPAETLEQSYWTIDGGANVTTDGVTPIEVSNLSASHLAGNAVTLYEDYRQIGQYTVSSNGTIPGVTSTGQNGQIGLPIRRRLKPFPPVVGSKERGFRQVRTGQCAVATRDSLAYSVYTGRYIRDNGNYSGLVTQSRVFNILGNNTEPEIELQSDTPGPMKITRIAWKVLV